MNRYNVLQPVYRVSHIERPPAPQRPYEVFHVEWRCVSTVLARTSESALLMAKLEGWQAPAIELVRATTH